MILHLLLADPACACRYRHDLLDDADAQRCLKQPQLATRTDWQSSRFLKQQYRRQTHGHTPFSLSHSGGFAALAYANAPGAIGVDLERMRRRDFTALLPLCARDAEMAWWWRQADATHAFYALWTIKEALIKAAGLDFPADLRQVGLFRQPGNGWRPGICHQQKVVYWSGFSQPVGGGLMLACVWQPPAQPERIVWHGHGQTRWQLPERLAGAPCTHGAGF